MPIWPHEFTDLAARLAPHLVGLPRTIIAVDGRPGAGKTTVARFLSWYFNVTLLQADLFLKRNGAYEHDGDEIKRIISLRNDASKPIIVECMAVLKVLGLIEVTPDLHIYVKNVAEEEGDEKLSEIFRPYEIQFSPESRCDFLVELRH
ncbi:MAG: hypothetical protein JF600_11060 [Xanthomonadales bacterium]|nr:hypothetical protein [Xanthomonadales bacterium]